MTVIVYKFPYMASDSRVTEENAIFTNKSKKIYRLKTGGLLGCCGDADDTELPTLLNKLKGKLPTHKQLCSLEFGLQALLVQPDKSVYVLEVEFDKDTSRYTSAIYPIGEPFIAIGSGSAWAMGALANGATVEQAVKTAIRFDNNCGGAVQTHKLESSE